MAAVRALPEALGNIDFGAFAIAAVTLAAAVLWPRRLSRFLPALLVALIAGTLLGVLWLRDAPVIGPIPTDLPSLQFTLPSAGFLVRALEPALILALLGSIDSLLTSLVAEFAYRNAPQPEPRAGGAGYRQHGFRAVRRACPGPAPPWAR